MPSNLKEKTQTENVALLDMVAFLITAAFDVLRTVLIILKTPMYVYNTSSITIRIL